MNKKKTVFVGLSGGVDSSVAALRLKNQGFSVIGVFIKVWHPDFMVCNWEAERLDAMRVAAHLEIPFLTCDAEAAYRDEVAEYFISEYKNGRTPNPDVLCNKEVKFGRFLEFATAHGADYIATGHYVNRKDIQEMAELHRGVDTDKDQSYFLWSLSNGQLQKALFPVGNSIKSVIRAEAARAEIPTATKKDSQGVCFLGHIDIPEFLSHYTTLTEGNVLNESGEIIGTHKGALVYTLGQRHGFTLETVDTNRTHMFVVAKNMQANTITVAPESSKVESGDTVTLHSVLLRSTIVSGAILEAQFRYRQNPFPVEVIEVGKEHLILRLAETTERPASGQSCVLYQGSLCVGGGIIN
jgi:tRNA-specific 2-thiouridylase